MFSVPGRPRFSSAVVCPRRARHILLIALIFIAIYYLLPSNPKLEGYIYRKIDGKTTSTPQFRIQHDFQGETATAKSVREDRQKQIRKAFVHAWTGYKEHAWLHDEVKPLSGGTKDPFVGWAATLVDSLDTIYIMGLQDEFDEALKALKTIDFTKPNSERVPVFEVTIRYLGGLLGAYDVSRGKYSLLLEKADELGDFLFHAFNTDNGIPVPYYWWNEPDRKLVGEHGVLVAQIGSLSLEFTRLAQLTGKTKYYDGIARITNHLDKAQKGTLIPGLWPSQVDTITPSFSGSAFTMGAWADSLYEYLPKQHILLAGKTNQYIKMYHAALTSASEHHFFKPKTPGNQDILFPGTVSVYNDRPTFHPEMQHLSCFVGGMVGLGARISQSPEELETAIRLTNGCVWAYSNTASGIMPEIFTTEPCGMLGCDWTDEEKTAKGHGYGFNSVSDTSYQLRPEAIESVFVMYRITGDPEWQEKGWRMFQAIMNHTVTDIANARITNVMSASPEQDDLMESFWLAETLKYFYLLFSEPSVISLDEFVLNTEAHPFRQRDHLF